MLTSVPSSMSCELHLAFGLVYVSMAHRLAGQKTQTGG